jgi:hypothetical protein
MFHLLQTNPREFQGKAFLLFKIIEKKLPNGRSMAVNLLKAWGIGEICSPNTN